MGLERAPGGKQPAGPSWGDDVVPGVPFIGLELVGLTLLFETVCLGKLVYLRETSGSISTS